MLSEPMHSRLLPSPRVLATDLIYVVAALQWGAIALAVWITGLTVSLTLSITYVGLPLLLLSFAVFRWMCEVERRRAAWVLGKPVKAHYRPLGSGAYHRRTWAMLRDPQRWLDLLWLILLFPLGLAAGIIALTLWGCALWFLTWPAWSWALPDSFDSTVDSWLGGTSWQSDLAHVAIGLVLVLVAAWVGRAMSVGLASAARAMLGSRSSELSARVEQLAATRAGTVDAQAAELQRIERDLHDGAQARLVALAVDLKLAERKLDSDPDGARELIGGAHTAATQALTELRDLVRGIYPRVLADRGLDPAITALAARCPVPVELEERVTQRLPAAVEAAAYFVVAEALANAAKHAGADSIAIRVRREASLLIVEVEDDGRGGADPAGEGLDGLQRRVRALDGRMLLSSPAGGPTVLRAELPCGS